MRALSTIPKSVALAGLGVIAGAAIFGGAWALAAGGTSVGGGTKVSTLPACAAGNDGQTVFYQTASMATTGTTWRLRCNSSSASTYKWEFVGGAPLMQPTANAGGTATTTSTTWVSYATQLPAITVPLAGEYDVAIGAHIGTQSAGTFSCYLSYQIGATAAVTTDGTYNSFVTQWTGGYTQTTHRKTLAASTTLTPYIRTSAVFTCVVADGMFSVTPVRVA